MMDGCIRSCREEKTSRWSFDLNEVITSNGDNILLENIRNRDDIVRTENAVMRSGRRKRTPNGLQ